MNSSWCECSGDPVGDALGELLEHLGESHLDDLAQARERLRTAQRKLVTSILGASCSRNPIVWLNTYVELDENLESLFQKVGALPDAAARISTLFLSAPTAITEADQESVTRAHTALWTALGAGERSLPEWALTSQLHLFEAHPGLIEFRAEQGSLVPRTQGVTLATTDENYQRAYTALVSTYPESLYVHLSLPAAARMRPMIGPAGAYLLVRDASCGETLPPCLWLHIRSFLQSLVTAFVWSVGEHLRWSIVEAVETFALNQLTFAKFSDTAERLRDMVDPVYVDTRPLASACRAAAKLFASPTAHTVAQWTAKSPEETKAGLTGLVEDLDRIAKGSRSELLATGLVDAIRAKISSLVNNGTASYEQAIRHAKALDHHSLCLSLLNEQYPPKTIVPFGTRNGANLVHLYEALVQLWERKSLVTFREENGSQYLLLTLSSSAKPVVKTALRLLAKEDVGSLKDMALSVAALVRGLFNATSRPADRNDWVSALIVEEEDREIRFQIESAEEP